MKHLVFLLLLIGALSAWTQLQGGAENTEDATSASVAPIPTTLDDCLRSIDKLWDLNSKDYALSQTETAFVESETKRFGGWIRSNWLVAGSGLAAHFHQMGITHVEDMTSIILTSYHRYLNQKPVGLDEQVKIHIAHWAKHEGK
jgi:hypothetical protein